MICKAAWYAFLLSGASNAPMPYLGAACNLQFFWLVEKVVSRGLWLSDEPQQILFPVIYPSGPCPEDGVQLDRDILGCKIYGNDFHCLSSVQLFRQTANKIRVAILIVNLHNGQDNGRRR